MAQTGTLNDDQGMLVTIFIPVFNGEKYLYSTLLSIKNQSYPNIEVLLVDDSSTDNSKNILDEFAGGDARFKVFVKENGGMAACSWNFIIPKITGNFVFYSSQDDLFSVNLIEKMVEKQQKDGAEIVLPDMEYYYENCINNKRTIGFNGNRNEVLSGKNAFLATINWRIHGFALIKTSLIIEEYFPEDAFDSDDFITRKIFLKSNKVVFCEGIFFYRQDNLNAITKTFCKKNFYTLNSAFKLYNLVSANNFSKNDIINIKFSLMFKYLEFTSILQFYNFESESDKMNIEEFLFNFRKSHFTQSFFGSNRLYAITRIKLRYLALLLIYESDVLFKFFVKLYSNKIKKMAD